MYGRRIRLRGPEHGARGDPATPRDGHETFRAPGRLQVIQAVPAGSVRLRGYTIERQYLDALGADPRLLELRAVARINTMRVAKYLARRASYTDGTTRRGGLAWWQLAGICTATWKAVRRRLEAWGYLGCVEEGTTPEFAPMALFRGSSNRAAVYVLCVPRKTRISPASPQVRLQTQPPTKSGRTSVVCPAREARPGEGETPSRVGSADAQPLRHVVRVMRKAAGQTITEGWAAWIWRPFAAAGWTVADLAWAIDHEPGGAQHRYSARIRHAAGWLRHRLSLWLDDAGQAVASITAQRQASRELARARAERHRAAMAAAAARWTDPGPHAAGIRAQFGWKGP
jgi:hypothetical protein